MSAPLVFPNWQWVAVTDESQIAEVVALANCAIASDGDHDELQLIAVSTLDEDAPADLQPWTPGVRILQLDLLQDEGRRRFLLALYGRPGSELLGFTPDETAEGAHLGRRVIAALLAGGRMTGEVRNDIESLVALLDHARSTPRRMQPIEVADVVAIHVCAAPHAEGAA